LPGFGAKRYTLPSAGLMGAMGKVFIAATTALALSACVYMQHGSTFDIDAVNKLVPGVSTEQDAIQLLGKPAAIDTRPDGTEVLQWIYVYGTAIGVGGGSHVAILFGSDKKMIQVTHLNHQ
jgi:hypothetical protein